MLPLPRLLWLYDTPPLSTLFTRPVLLFLTRSDDTKLFHEMETFLGEDGGLRLVPVRILKGSTSPSQLPIPTERPNGKLRLFYMVWTVYPS